MHSLVRVYFRILLERGQIHSGKFPEGPNTNSRGAIPDKISGKPITRLEGGSTPLKLTRPNYDNSSPSYSVHEKIVNDEDRPEGSRDMNVAPLSGENNDGLQNHHNQHYCLHINAIVGDELDWFHYLLSLGNGGL